MCVWVCKTLANFTYHFIRNGKFWLPPAFDNSHGLENDAGMENRSGYKAILENNP